MQVLDAHLLCRRIVPCRTVRLKCECFNWKILGIYMDKTYAPQQQLNV